MLFFVLRNAEEHPMDTAFAMLRNTLISQSIARFVVP